MSRRRSPASPRTRGEESRNAFSSSLPRMRGGAVLPLRTEPVAAPSPTPCRRQRLPPPPAGQGMGGGTPARAPGRGVGGGGGGRRAPRAPAPPAPRPGARVGGSGGGGGGGGGGCGDACRRHELGRSLQLHGRGGVLTRPMRRSRDAP